jgi:hypothetical protein
VENDGQRRCLLASSAGRLIATLSLMMSSCVSRRSRGGSGSSSVGSEGFQGCVGVWSVLVRAI